MKEFRLKPLHKKRSNNAITPGTIPFPFFKKNIMMIFNYLLLLFLVNAAPMGNFLSAPASSPDQPPKRLTGGDQCRIVLKAWTTLGGNPNDFPTPTEQCCGQLGIECDNNRNIIGINWSHEILNGTASFELGKLSQAREELRQLPHLKEFNLPYKSGPGITPPVVSSLASNEDVGLSSGTQSIDHALDTVSNATQCKIAFEAWIKMGGNPNDFPKPRKDCCGKSGIKCDKEGNGNIVGIEWDLKNWIGKWSLKSEDLSLVEEELRRKLPHLKELNLPYQYAPASFSDDFSGPHFSGNRSPRSSVKPDEFIPFIHGSAGAFLFPILAKTNGYLYPLGDLMRHFHIAPLGGEANYLQYYFGGNDYDLSTLRTGEKDFKLAWEYAQLKGKSYKDVKEMEDFYSKNFLDALKELESFDPKTATHSILFEASKLKFHTLQLRTFCDDCYLNLIAQEGMQDRIAQVQSFDLHSKESLHTKERMSLGTMGRMTVILTYVKKWMYLSAAEFIKNPIRFYHEWRNSQENIKYQQLSPISNISTIDVLDVISLQEDFAGILRVTGILKDGWYETIESRQRNYQEKLQYLDSNYHPKITLNEEDRKFMMEPLPVILEGRVPKFRIENSSNSPGMRLQGPVDLKKDIVRIHVKNEHDKIRLESWLKSHGFEIPVELLSARELFNH